MAPLADRVIMKGGNIFLSLQSFLAICRKGFYRLSLAYMRRGFRLPYACRRGYVAASWFQMGVGAEGDEVNSWDLSSASDRGFGVAGMDVPGCAEPDLEQQWITSAEAQLAPAATRTLALEQLTRKLEAADGRALDTGLQISSEEKPRRAKRKS